MFRLFVFLNLMVLSVLGFAQQNYGLNITGRVPSADSQEMYRVQVGAFLVESNAEGTYERLRTASLNPVYEKYNGFTRVLITGIRANEIPALLTTIKNIGFNDAFIKIDTASNPQSVTSTNNIIRPVSQLAISNVVLPSPELTEIGTRTIRVGETRSLNDLVEGRNVTRWTSSTSSSVIVNTNGVVSGQTLGNAFITINEREYISIVVVPQEDFFIVPEVMSVLLPAASRRSSSTFNISEYRTEPTFRLSYRFNNKGENFGASGRNGGIDILGRGEGYEWLWTTFFQGGWFYNLNGVMREMIDGYQMGANGVSLRVIPEFVYEKGVPYLQLRHQLNNTNNFAVIEQRFGASADVMIHNNDEASLVLTPYGAYMTDSTTNPSLELMFVCLSGNGINPVDTLWLGEWLDGDHLYYVYEDRRINVHNADSAIGFSYQNINLGPRETKEFIVRFTLARHER